MNAIKRFLADEQGATAIEYGILAALIATALGAVFYPRLQILYRTLFSTMSENATTAANKQ